MVPSRDTSQLTHVSEIVCNKKKSSYYTLITFHAVQVVKSIFLRVFTFTSDVRTEPLDCLVVLQTTSSCESQSIVAQIFLNKWEFIWYRISYWCIVIDVQHWYCSSVSSAKELCSCGALWRALGTTGGSPQYPLLWTVLHNIRINLFIYWQKFFYRNMYGKQAGQNAIYQKDKKK